MTAKGINGFSNPQSLKGVDRGLWCVKRQIKVGNRFRDCSFYERDQPRVRQHNFILSSPGSKTGFCFRLTVSSCVNCVYAVNAKDVLR